VACRSLLVAFLCLFFPAAALADLAADNLLLVVNKNSPQSLHLAQVYAAARNVPPDRICSVDVPDAEEMDFQSEQTNVRAVIRQYLIDHQLTSQVTCLVTFYGVPFRVLPKTDTDAESAELADLKAQLNKTLDAGEPAVADSETLAQSLDPTFTPTSRPSQADNIEDLMRRSNSAFNAAGLALNSIADPAARQQDVTQLVALLVKLGGNVQLVSRFGRSQLADPNLAPSEHLHWLNLRDEAISAEMLRAQLQGRPFDADARSRLRQLATNQFGLLNLAGLLQQQIIYLTPDKYPGALDSDLALLWWNTYMHHQLQNNPLNYRFVAEGLRTTPVLMVSRLDGPDPQIVENMIHTSVQVEHDGLQGCIAIDSRGMSPFDADGKPNAYGEFDQTLRHLAELAENKTHLKVVHEDTERLFRPGEVTGGALYCGWYSVRHYIPGVQFNPGAVGYHVASFEMISLHNDHEPGWVHGLLSDGVVATVGSVAEPYLLSFPHPDEFFPLLMTGKLTLAEVYWKTEPMVAWQMCLVGDPLYRPYAADPAMSLTDLPAPLQAALTP